MRRNISQIFLIWIAISWSVLAEDSDVQMPADHPTKILGQAKGSDVLVSSVSRQKPKGLLDGRRVSVEKKSGFKRSRDTHYAMGKIEVHKIEGGTMFIQTRDVDSGALLGGGRGYSECRLEISADRDLDDVYCAMMFDVPLSHQAVGYLGSPTVIFKEVGELKAGISKEIVVDLGILSSYDQMRLVFFPMFFTAGRELRSSHWEMGAEYGRFFEEKQHRRVLQNYLEMNQGKDHSFLLYVKFSPVFDDESTRATLPPEVRAKLVFDSNGVVSDVQIDEELSAEAMRDIKRCLYGWLALPPLNLGTPTGLRIVVPLRFGKSPKASD